MLYALLFAATIPWIWSQGRLTIQTKTLLLAMLGPSVGVILAIALGLGHGGAAISSRLAELSPFTLVVGPFVLSLFEVALVAAVAFGPFWLIQKLGVGQKSELD